jgi:glycosyltransferase involved in cell wall biosynthesis
MNILFLSAWCPYPADNGSKLRIAHLVRGLAAAHAVDFISFCSEGDEGSRAAQLRSYCREVHLLHETPFAARRVSRLRSGLAPQPHSLLADHSPTMAALAGGQAASRDYDIVVASELHMLPYALPLHLPIVLEDLELAALRDQVARAGSPRRWLRAALTWWKTARYLRSVLRGVAGVSVVSDAERAIVDGLAPRHCPLEVVPNGVDLAGCAGDWPPPEPDTLIYPGALSYDANFDAVAYFLQAIWPRVRAARPATRLRVTGRATPAQIQALPPAEGVEFTGYLDDVRPAVAGAWAEVVPLRKGGGTRLKVLEAMALGTPVVATSKGAEGLDLRHGQELLVADAPDAFADQTLRLLESPALRDELAWRGRQAAARYDWRLSVERLEQLLQRALPPRPPVSLARPNSA